MLGLYISEVLPQLPLPLGCNKEGRIDRGPVNGFLLYLGTHTRTCFFFFFLTREVTNIHIYMAGLLLHLRPIPPFGIY